MEICEEYFTLVERLIKVDNYRDMAMILDIGFSGLEIVKEYSEKVEFGVENKIEKYKREIERLEKQNNEIIIERKKAEEKFYDENISIRKEVERKYMDELDKKSERINDLGEEILRIKNEYIEKIVDISKIAKEEFFSELEKLKIEKNAEIEYFKNTLKESKQEFDERLSKDIITLKEEYERELTVISEENMKYKEKYEKLELKSVKKGVPYEDALFDELNKYFEKFNNIYKITRCSNMAGKGDFIITNNYSKIKIMMEAKNMPSVSATIKDQLPKFYKDVNDDINQYDGAFIVAMGKIESKKNYEMEVLNKNRVVSFVENYTLNMPEKLYLILEIIHQKIQDLRSTKELSPNKILENQVELYKIAKECYKKLKLSLDSQCEILNKIKMDILNIFDIDIEEYLLEKNNNKKDSKEHISKKVEDFVKLEIKKDSKISREKLKKNVNKEFQQYIELYEKERTGISKTAITNIIKKEVENKINITINTTYEDDDNTVC